MLLWDQNDFLIFSNFIYSMRKANNLLYNTIDVKLHTKNKYYLYVS